MLAAACASSTDAGNTDPAKAADGGTLTAADDAPATIAQALRLIPDTGWDEDFIGFGATARMTAADGSADPGTYSMYYALADPLIELPGPQGEQQQLPVLGFDPQKAAFSVTVTGGTQPQPSATILFGSFDTTAIGTTLAATGLTRTGSSAGATTWTYKSNQSTSEFPMTASNDSVPGTIDVSPSRLVLSPTASPVTAISAPATKPLSQNPMADALADCLGPAITGMIGRIYQQSDVPGPTTGALGITPGPNNATSVEVCVAADNPSAAQAMETRWATGIRTGHDAGSNNDLAWSSILTNPQATTANQSPDIVRLSAEIAPGVDPANILDEYLGGPISTLILPQAS
jgi:hypothetical protein